MTITTNHRGSHPIPRQVTPAVTLTAHSIAKEAPGALVREIRDAIVPGLRLVVHPSPKSGQGPGVKSFTVRYWLYKRHRNLTLGRWPRVSLNAARDAARAALDQVAHGVDPADKKSADNSFESAVALYIERRVSKLRASTATYTRRELDVAVKAWRGRPLASITRRDVIALIDTAETRGATVRDSLLRILSAFFAWCENRDDITASPTRGIERHRKDPRERVLDDQELIAVWRAADRVGGAVGALTKLLILSGCRRNEIAFLTWTEVGKDVIELSAERVKTGKKFQIPITVAMRKVFDDLPRAGRYVLRGKRPLHVAGEHKTALDVTIPHWTWHDLRRSFASGLARLGISIDVIERCLNHKLPGIIAVYQRHDYAKEIQLAFERWSAHIESITAERSN